MIRTFAGYVLAGTAVVACPCHLALTLPLALTLLGGSSLGALLATRTDLVFATSIIYFVVALILAFTLLSHRAARPVVEADGCGCPADSHLSWRPAPLPTSASRATPEAEAPGSGAAIPPPQRGAVDLETIQATRHVQTKPSASSAGGQ